MLVLGLLALCIGIIIKQQMDLYNLKWRLRHKDIKLVHYIKNIRYELKRIMDAMEEKDDN